MDSLRWFLTSIDSAPAGLFGIELATAIDVTLEIALLHDGGTCAAVVDD